MQQQIIHNICQYFHGDIVRNESGLIMPSFIDVGTDELAIFAYSPLENNMPAL